MDETTVPALRDPATWHAVAERIGRHPYTYDLDDDSHRLDGVQIVCEALAAIAQDSGSSAAAQPRS